MTVLALLAAAPAAGAAAWSCPGAVARRMDRAARLVERARVDRLRARPATADRRLRRVAQALARLRRHAARSRMGPDCRGAVLAEVAGLADLVPAVEATPPRAPVVVCLGDSITWGTGDRTRDPAGGFPGRLQRRVGDRLRVVNRGLPAATTATWLLDPRSDAGRRWWRIARALWDPPRPPPEAAAPTLLAAVLRDDPPDLVVLLLGINDLTLRVDAPAVLEGLEVRLAVVVAEARRLAPRVLVSTLLPTPYVREALRRRVNRRLPVPRPDLLPFGARFAAAGAPRLRDDRIHPNADGHALLARLLHRELAARGYVSARVERDALPSAPRAAQ